MTEILIISAGIVLMLACALIAAWADIKADEIRDDARGPRCPCCRGPLISYSSMDIRECVDCGHMYAWELKPGQKPLVTNNRHDRKEQAQ